MHQIQFTSGCPNNCRYCYEPKEVRVLAPVYPKKGEYNQILDMNFLANPDVMDILKGLPKAKYELVCGVDYRRLSPEICGLLKKKNFIKIRWAWDYTFTQQKIHKKVWQMLTRAGFKSEELSVFILVNWKTPYLDCCRKLDLLKVWNVKVNDCCWDGGYKIAKPHYWDLNHIMRFRAACRKHNQIVRFKIDPEL